MDAGKHGDVSPLSKVWHHCGLTQLDEICTACATPAPHTPLATITVRLPRPIHRRLLDLAAADSTSLNRLCVAALAALTPNA